MRRYWSIAGIVASGLIASCLSVTGCHEPSRGYYYGGYPYPDNRVFVEPGYGHYREYEFERGHHHEGFRHEERERHEEHHEGHHEEHHEEHH